MIASMILLHLPKLLDYQRPDRSQIFCMIRPPHYLNLVRTVLVPVVEFAPVDGIRVTFS